MSIDEFPWPAQGEVLFRGDQRDWHNNARINFDPDAWLGYAEGFKRGADVMVEHVVAHAADQDRLVYPIVYGYRHSVELLLKVATRDVSRLLNNVNTPASTHRLQVLWANCRPLLEQAYPDGPAADLNALEEAVVQLDAADPESQDFRYPVDTRGRATLSNVGLHINLRHLRDVMAGIHNFLVSALSTIDREREIKLEMERDIGWQ